MWSRRWRIQQKLVIFKLTSTGSYSPRLLKIANKHCLLFSANPWFDFLTFNTLSVNFSSLLTRTKQQGCGKYFTFTISESYLNCSFKLTFPGKVVRLFGFSLRNMDLAFIWRFCDQILLASNSKGLKRSSFSPKGQTTL